MTKSKIVALLSVLALLASLPLSVALAQQPYPSGWSAIAMLDGQAAMDGTMVVAMIGDEKVGEAMVGMDGMFMIDVDGEMDSMVMFSLMMGEGEEMMSYMASSDEDDGGHEGRGSCSRLMTPVPPTKTPQEEMEA